MVHLSRLAEEIVWWSNPRFGFLRPSDAYSTGSSMMPNKRNPDPAELVRGRTAGVIGQLTGTLTLLKGLPASYQRDLQEDKPPLFAAFRVLESSLRVMTGMIAGLRVDGDRMIAVAARRLHDRDRGRRHARRAGGAVPVGARHRGRPRRRWPRAAGRRWTRCRTSCHRDALRGANDDTAAGTGE